MRRPLFRTAATSVATLALLITTSADPALADSAPVFADPGPTESVVLAVNDLPTVIGNLTGWITGIIATIATLFLTIGGTRYLMAGGDPSEVERAKGSLKSAGIGYALALLAPILLTILNKALGV